MNTQQFEPITTNLSIEIFETGKEATEAGFNYFDKPEFNGIKIQKAIVVKEGTIEGNSTVDFISIDQFGNKHVVMITANLLRAVIAACKPAA